MRIVGVVIAALLTLGLAAFGVVTAQNAAGSSSLIALAAHFISPPQSTHTATAQAPASQPPAPVAQARVVQTPVIQVAQAASASRSDAPPAPAPTVLAQNSAAPAAAPAAPPPPAAAPASAASPPPAAKAIPACNNPDAIGLARVVEIDTTGGPAFG
ncbi:MAG TPA: hypothetical protein VEK31_04350, partial [Xanthobacteraceae bacterium]|nr:hypothetical protein [Xanthobacteraceae bacterium]